MAKLDNKIEASAKNLREILSQQKYTIDYFQREYSWSIKHIEQLIIDLTNSFLNEYKEGDSREEGEGYSNYYMGSFIVSLANNKKSIIDGQQRLTSLTLFLVYLNNLAKEQNLDLDISNMIFSELRGKKSFNIEVEERVECLESLFKTGDYVLKDNDNESTKNMLERYKDIDNFFPNEEINNNSLIMFIDWIMYNVILVEIIAYSDENAYTIFETMNDRGLNLTPTEMLKGFLLSKLSENKRQEINKLWKENIKKLKDLDDDQSFFQDWLRAKYADSIRQGKQGSQNEDFEKIGTRFHSWVKENLDKLGLKESNEKSFYDFIVKDLNFYLNAYEIILNATNEYHKELENVYYIDDWGIARSLSYPLMLASLTLSDDKDTIKNKINIVAKYVEIFAVKRAVNYKKFAYSSIKYTFYTLIKEIRNKNIDELKDILNTKLDVMPEKWSKFSNFGMHGQNKKFVKFLLSRISSYIDNCAGINTEYDTYFRPKNKPFEIEHILANKYERHKDEFSEKADFDIYRNKIGDLVLLPKGNNQSYSDKEYAEKYKHYVKENLLVKSLTQLAYENNPNFINMIKNKNFPFKAHIEFKKEDIMERQKLYQKICENIWDKV